jgi:hypothetical protein
VDLFFNANDMTDNKPVVLVLGVVPSLTWLVARCLTRAGHRPYVMCWHGYSAIRFSADCRDYFIWDQLHRTDGKLDSKALEQVQALCRRKSVDVVMAADYDAALLLAEHGQDAQIRCAAVPDAMTIMTFNNKWTFSRLLQHLEIPFPDSHYAANATQLLATPLAFPMITKPIDKWASVGFELHRDMAQLQATVRQGRLLSSYPLIAQCYVPGWDVGASFIARDGQLVAFSMFQHKKKGERVFYNAPRVRAYLETFVAVTAYCGVGHIDLRYDPARDSYRVLELNPRFWASLLYAADAGLNYPEMLLKLEQWDGAPARQAAPGPVRLGAYERSMTLGNRWFGHAYERLTGAVL